MDELNLTQALEDNIHAWMIPKYAIGTVNNRRNYIRSLTVKYKVLNTNTLRKIMKSVKHQHQRACITMINDYCYENNIDFNIIVPSIKKQPTKIPDLLSPAEIKLMVQSAPRPYDLAIRCIFNMGAGLRVSEIIKIQWDDIGWVDWLANQERYGVAVIKAGKGSKDRAVNIPKLLMQDLYNYAKDQKVLNEFLIPTGRMIFKFGVDEVENFMQELRQENFDKWKNEYIKTSYNWFRYHIIQGCCEKALNKKIKIHSLRHSRATYLYEVEKVPVEKIQVLLGHSSINTTMLYTKINPVSVFELIKDTKEV